MDIIIKKAKEAIFDAGGKMTQKNIVFEILGWYGMIAVIVAYG